MVIIDFKSSISNRNNWLKTEMSNQQIRVTVVLNSFIKEYNYSELNCLNQIF